MCVLVHCSLTPGLLFKSVIPIGLEVPGTEPFDRDTSTEVGQEQLICLRCGNKDSYRQRSLEYLTRVAKGIGTKSPFVFA